ncbi:BTG family protein [Streptomyces cylindrosporus]|uniref:BTG family protein n=1 Tax=Streptomyces cylindrosporus TaxID=2927583 RepID=A0ABS9YJS1_9ACTN|nr:BTG family protein [Streptomyces cylindrosporus]MCI3277502.1 BTG family protein [Streptomyces cylindrosporus]
MTPRPEAVAAADWWAQKLAGPAEHDNGRGAEESTALANAVSALVRRQRSAAEIEAFREALADEIEQHIGQYGWRPDEPDFGSAMRAILVDYGPDPVLAHAAEKAGFQLRMLDLPLKTVMWINPGIVKVAEGYSAQPVVIWSAAA